MIRLLLTAPKSVLLLAAAWGVGLAAAGIVATRLDAWYYALRFPGWKPPDWLFGPAWTTIFACASVALVLGWTAPGATTATRNWLLAAWLLNATLNVLWSVLFFRWHRPDWALLEIGPLWLSIVGMVVALVRTVPQGGWLLAPYLTWVAFAAVLNRAIVERNGPFGGS